MLQSESPASRPVRSRSTTTLNPTLDRHLAAYVAAATAAGVSMFAATPAAAKVVYTPVDITIGSSGYALDLNHDGIPDFTLHIAGIGESDGIITILNLELDVPGNAVRPQKGSPDSAGALRTGAKIGPDKSFTTFLSSYGGVFMYARGSFTHTGVKSTFSNGPWAKQTRKYLGLKFLINGRFHYGWARLTTGPDTGIVLSGYAYQTKAGTEINAGQTSSSDDGTDIDDASVPSSTLGALAKGAASVTISPRANQ